MELGPVILDYFGDTFLVELGYQFHSGFAQPPLAQSAIKNASDLLSFSIVRQTFAVYDADSAGFMSDAQLPLIGISAR
jgi:hypothetical protein